MGQIQITSALAIDEDELDERFIQSSGPGGQNVNKVATAVQLRFDAARSPSLSDEFRARLARLAGRRMTREGILVIEAKRFRTQERNREDARARLMDLLERASVPPKPRKKLRPSRAAKEERLDAKSKRSATKKLRGKPALK